MTPPPLSENILSVIFKCVRFPCPNEVGGYTRGGRPGWVALEEKKTVRRASAGRLVCRGSAQRVGSRGGRRGPGQAGRPSQAVSVRGRRASVRWGRGVSGVGLTGQEGTRGAGRRR